MKSELLDILSQSNNSPISGQKISETIGVSRVSIWKQIQNLQKLGYPIKSSSRGYYLESSNDCLYAWEFPEHQDRFHFFPELSSTMVKAKELAKEGCPNFTVVATDRQLEGRGRLDRTWDSQQGGLYFTIVLRPKVPPAMMHQYSFLASVTLVEILREVYSIDAQIKWPNDILVAGGKICGMLCEMQVEADLVKNLNIGIGINVNHQPNIEGQPTTSIKNLIGRSVERKEILGEFINRFKSYLETKDFSWTLTQWKKYTATLNRPVKIKTTQDIILGKAIDIEDSGALLVELSDGKTELVYFGDCFHLDR